MRIKEQKQLWQLITDLGIEKTTKLLTSFVLDDEFDLYLEDEVSLLYLAFSGYINSGNHQDLDSAISGFIQFNLHKGDKLFKKKDVKKIDTTDIEEKFYKHFGIQKEETPNSSLTKEECLKIFNSYNNNKYII